MVYCESLPDAWVSMPKYRHLHKRVSGPVAVIYSLALAMCSRARLGPAAELACIDRELTIP